MIWQSLPFDDADVQVVAVPLHFLQLLHQGLVVARQNVVHGALFQTCVISNAAASLSLHPQTHSSVTEPCTGGCDPNLQDNATVQQLQRAEGDWGRGLCKKVRFDCTYHTFS